MQPTTINIIIPAFNEGTYIYSVVEEIVSVKSDFNEDFLLIVIDDFSNDNTASEIIRAKSDFTEIEISVIRNSQNSGKGFSIRSALSRCKPGIIIIQDADLEYSPSEYKKLVSPILKNKTDVVYGSRFQGSEPKRVLYFTHYVANRWLTTISNIFTGLNLSDMETCYKVFKTDLIEQINLKENRFGFEPEITAKLSRIKGVRFAEVGISYFGRTYSEGKKINFFDAVHALYCVFKYNIWSRK